MTKLFKVVGITLLLNIIVPLVCISNLIASEFNSILKGEYVFSTTRICANGPSNPDLSRSADGSISLAFLEAILTFNGDGSGTATWSSILSINPTQIYAGQYPVWQGSASGIITYEVFEDKTFQVEILVTSQPPPNTTVLIDGITLDGWIGPGNQLLFMNDTQPNIEIGTLENGDTWERICGRSTRAIRKR